MNFYVIKADKNIVKKLMCKGFADKFAGCDSKPFRWILLKRMHVAARQSLHLYLHLELGADFGHSL